MSLEDIGVVKVKVEEMRDLRSGTLDIMTRLEGYDRTCQVCARHEEQYPRLRWTQMPPVKALGGSRPWVDTECWDGLTIEMRDHIAAQDHDIVQLRKALQDAAKLLDMMSPTGEIHP